MTVGLTRDAGWQIGVSRTVPASPRRVWEVLVGEPSQWLGAGASLPSAVGQEWWADDGTRGELRSRHDLDRIRLTARRPGAHETTVQVTVRPAGTGTVLRFHQERMVDPQERSAQREHWRAVLDRLAASLDEEGR